MATEAAAGPPPPAPSAAAGGGGGGGAAPSLKDQGNESFKAGNYLKAAALYTQAIKSDPSNATLYSNRSAAFLHLVKLSKALADAETTITLNPQWEKGYFRKGCVLEAMGRYDDAVAALQVALQHNPQSTEVSRKIKRLMQLARDQKRALEVENMRSNVDMRKYLDPLNDELILELRACLVLLPAGNSLGLPSLSTRSLGSVIRWRKLVIPMFISFQLLTASLKKALSQGVRYGIKPVLAGNLLPKQLVHHLMSNAASSWILGCSANDIVIMSERIGRGEELQDIFSFIVDIMEAAVKVWHDTGKVDPRANFLLDKEKTQTDKYAPVVNIDKAFESPHTHSSCFLFLRQYAEDSFSRAACLIVPKGIISYPQVWKGQGSRKWKHGQSDGFFVQFESPVLRKLWFVSSSSEKGLILCKDPEVLDVSAHEVLPRLFKERNPSHG